MVTVDASTGPAIPGQRLFLRDTHIPSSVGININYFVSSIAGGGETHRPAFFSTKKNVVNFECSDKYFGHYNINEKTKADAIMHISKCLQTQGCMIEKETLVEYCKRVDF